MLYIRVCNTSSGCSYSDLRFWTPVHLFKIFRNESICEPFPSSLCREFHTDKSFFIFMTKITIIIVHS